MDILNLVRASKALSDETRLRMLKLLLDRDVCVCEMEEIFPLSHSQVSRHLRILMDAGFLTRWHENHCVVYQTRQEVASLYCRAILDALVESLNDNATVAEDRAKLAEVIARKLRSGGK